VKRGFFVTGTDTGVGKTYVTAALARCERSLGRTVFAFKPIETGCRWIGTELVGEDQLLLCDAAGDWQRGRLAGAYRFTSPVAPLVAASKARERIDVADVIALVREGSRLADLTLVEGAGGWRVPITEQVRMSELARELGFPIIVVARATLGTLNHTVLTIEAVERDGCELAAIVMSRRPEDDIDLATSNLGQIERLTGCRPIVVSADDPSSQLESFLVDTMRQSADTH
jgi:dethiobiotin synthetase